MSDRFYMQKCAFANISSADLIYTERHPDSKEATALNNKILKKLGGSSIKVGKRVLKADVVAEIQELLNTPVLGLEKLVMLDLDKLLFNIKNYNNTITLPTGRTKAPYIKELNRALASDIDFSKLTVKTLTDLINALKS